MNERVGIQHIWYMHYKGGMAYVLYTAYAMTATGHSRIARAAPTRIDMRHVRSPLLHDFLSRSPVLEAAALQRSYAYAPADNCRAIRIDFRSPLRSNAVADTREGVARNHAFFHSSTTMSVPGCRDVCYYTYTYGMHICQEGFAYMEPDAKHSYALVVVVDRHHACNNGLV